VVPLERAHEFTDSPVKVLASAQGERHHRGSTTGGHLHPGRHPWRQGSGAFARAGLHHKEIDLVGEVHDCFTTGSPEIRARLTDLRVYCKKKGDMAGRLTAEGDDKPSKR